VQQLRGNEAEGVAMEKLKALARQILILAPNIRPYLLTADESK
jgi:hypothetical protein